MSLVTLIGKTITDALVDRGAPRKNEGFSSDLVIGLLAGIGIGAIGALLLAPSSGEELRGRIGDEARTRSKGLRDQADNLRSKASDLYDDGVQVIDRTKKDVAEAVDAGKQAFDDARTPKAAKA